MNEEEEQSGETTEEVMETVTEVGDEPDQKSLDEVDATEAILNKIRKPLSAVMLYQGKQYRIEEGKSVVLPTTKDFSEVKLFVSDILIAKQEQTIIGTPKIEGASASLSRHEPLRLRRETNFKRRRRKNSSKRTKGVRIYSMKCQVDEIVVPAFGSETVAAGSSA